jgi:hypothetical protein
MLTLFSYFKILNYYQQQILYSELLRVRKWQIIIKAAFAIDK